MSEPGSLVLESSTRISGYFAPTDPEHKFNKTENENWLPLGYNLGSSWLGTRSHNHYAMFTHWWGESSRFIYPSIKSWNDPGNISLLWKCASVPKPPIHHPEYTVQKMKFPLRTSSVNAKKSFMENFIFFAVVASTTNGIKTKHH